MKLTCSECGNPLAGRQRKFCSKRCVNIDYQRQNRESLNRRMREKYRNDPVHRARHLELVKKRRARNRESLNRRMREKYRNDPVHRARHLELVRSRRARIKREKETEKR